MVLSGGVIGSFLLLIVVFAAYDFKYKRTQILSSGKFYNVAFWISILTILTVALYGVIGFL